MNNYTTPLSNYKNTIEKTKPQLRTTTKTQLKIRKTHLTMYKSAVQQLQKHHSKITKPPFEQLQQAPLQKQRAIIQKNTENVYKQYFKFAKQHFNRNACLHKTILCYFSFIFARARARQRIPKIDYLNLASHFFALRKKNKKRSTRRGCFTWKTFKRKVLAFFVVFQSFAVIFMRFFL